MIDLTELTGEIQSNDERERFLSSLMRILDRMGDPFKMPEAMVEWLHNQDHIKVGVDSYYTAPVGYGSLNLQLRFIFKKDMIIMEFVNPYGMRLMELRLHAL